MAPPQGGRGWASARQVWPVAATTSCSMARAHQRPTARRGIAQAPASVATGGDTQLASSACTAPPDDYRFVGHPAVPWGRRSSAARWRDHTTQSGFRVAGGCGYISASCGYDSGASDISCSSHIKILLPEVVSAIALYTIYATKPVVFIHHSTKYERKGKREARESGALEGAVDMMASVTLDDDLITLTCEKSK